MQAHAEHQPPRRFSPVMWLLLALAASPLLISLLRNARPLHADIIPPDRRAIMPPFTIPDLDGKTWSLDEHRGKVVLVNFFATWCPPCQSETPDLVAAAAEYGPKGLVVVGVSLDRGDAEIVRQFARQYKIPYPVLMPPSSAPVTQNITSIPVTILLDRQGRVAANTVGAVSASTLGHNIHTLLAEPG